MSALLDVICSDGTLVVPAFSGESASAFTPETPTTMGAVPTALLAWPGRVRSAHPQVSVAAVGQESVPVCARQPWAYALGAQSPFDEIVHRRGRILLIGVGHNRSSMLHHSESLIADHRRKVRRFVVEHDKGARWVEVPNVGNDNDTYFAVVGAEFERQDPSVRVGHARSTLFDAAPYDTFARNDSPSSCPAATECNARSRPVRNMAAHRNIRLIAR